MSDAQSADYEREPRPWRKKPVEVMVFGPITYDNIAGIAHWCGGAVSRSLGYLAIQTLEGRMEATIGDYVIQGVKGEFYPCKPDIFEATYEPVDPTHNDGDVSDAAL